MLFDLRSRGRRRTVQAVYVGLALLFLVGFLGFGVGGGFGGGGILENVFGKEGGSGGSTFASQVAAAEKRVHKNPSDAEGWAKLADARFHEASSSEFFNEETQKYTAAGKELLLKISEAWSHYMTLKPTKPNLTVAQEMLGVYGQNALNQPAENVQVLQQVLIPNKPPTAALYGYLAEFAYQANNPHVGDLASKKTIELTPTAQRATVKQDLERVKANPSGNPANEKYTSTVHGKKYEFKTKNGKNFEGRPVKPEKKK